MYNILHKYKRTLFFIVKLIIVFGAFYFIYQKLMNNGLLTIGELKLQVSVLWTHSAWMLLLLLLLTDLNWLLEIVKWQNLASVEKKITFFEAYEQCFASLTASMITPNRIGEYGAKALFYKVPNRKNIMGLNLLGNLSQLVTTSFFGVIGLVFFLINFKVQTPKIKIQYSLIFVIIIVLVILFIRNDNFKKAKLFLRQISKKTYFLTLVLAVFRYLVFTHQFYFLIILFELNVDYFTAMCLIFSTYFMASVLPSLTIFDWVIKGSVAIFVFGFVEVNELTIVTITTFMYLLNFAIPAIIGSIFVFNYKPISNK